MSTTVSPTIDLTVDTAIRERFETVLPDGTVFTGFIDPEGRYVVMPGTVDAHTFAEEATLLIAESAEMCLLGSHTRLYDYVMKCAQVVRPVDVQHTFARPELDEYGVIQLDWNVAQHDAGVIAVTLFEA